MMKGGFKMARIYNRRIAAKLLGEKQTTIWISGKHLPIIKDLGVSNQEFAQAVYDSTMGLIIRVDLNSDYSKVIDASGNAMTNANYKQLAEILAQEIVSRLQNKEVEK